MTRKIPNKFHFEFNRLLLCCIFSAFFILHFNSYAQLSVNSANGIVGEEISLNMLITLPPIDTGKISVRGELKLSNPTVFYPDSLTIESGLFFSNELKRINDSLYSFSFEISGYSSSQKEIILQLHGEALAGSDTICRLNFRNLVFNGFTIPDIETYVGTNAVGSQIPYIRIVRLEQNYPNPINFGNSTKWVYSIDADSKVVFSFFNLLMQEKEVIDLGFVKRGVHEFYWTPERNVASGVYWMFLKTENSVDFKNFIITK